jgi:hypothetical protein
LIFYPSRIQKPTGSATLCNYHISVYKTADQFRTVKRGKIGHLLTFKSKLKIV